MSMNPFERLQAYCDLAEFIECEAESFFEPWQPIIDACTHMAFTDGFGGDITNPESEDVVVPPHVRAGSLIDGVAVIRKYSAIESLESAIAGWSESDDIETNIIGRLIREALKDDFHAVELLYKQVDQFKNELKEKKIRSGLFLLSEDILAGIRPGRAMQWKLRFDSKLNELGLTQKEASDWSLSEREKLTDAACNYLDSMLEDVEQQSEQIPSTPDLTQAVVTKRSKGMTVEKANEEGKKLSKKEGRNFWRMSKRAQAKRIGCSFDTWSKTNICKTKSEKYQEAHGHRSQSRKAVALTEQVADEHQLKRHMETKRDQELNKLVKDQIRDREPSPFDPQRRRVVAYRTT